MVLILVFWPMHFRMYSRWQNLSINPSPYSMWRPIIPLVTWGSMPHLPSSYSQLIFLHQTWLHTPFHRSFKLCYPCSFSNVHRKLSGRIFLYLLQRWSTREPSQDRRGSCSKASNKSGFWCAQSQAVSTAAWVHWETLEGWKMQGMSQL